MHKSRPASPPVPPLQLACPPVPPLQLACSSVSSSTTNTRLQLDTNEGLPDLLKQRSPGSTSIVGQAVIILSRIRLCYSVGMVTSQAPAEVTTSPRKESTVGKKRFRPDLGHNIRPSLLKRKMKAKLKFIGQLLNPAKGDQVRYNPLYRPT